MPSVVLIILMVVLVLGSAYGFLRQRGSYQRLARKVQEQQQIISQLKETVEKLLKVH